MNIIEALRPVIRIFQMFGLSAAQFCTFKYIPFHRIIIKYYFFLLIATRFSIFCYISMKYHLSPTEDKVHSVIDVVSIASAHWLEIVILLEAFIKSHQDEAFMANFLQIDNLLIQHFGIDLKMNKLRISVVKRLAIWISIIGIDSCYRLLKRCNTQYFGQELIWTLAFLSASLSYFQITIWADLIRYRLRLVTRLIYELKCEQNQKIEHDKTSHKSNESNGQIFVMTCYDRIENANENNDAIGDTHIFNQLCILCDLYSRLWMQANRLNERFNFSMVLNIGNDFGYLVFQLYFVFICLRKLATCDFLTTDFSVCVVNIFHLSMLSRAGQNMADEAVKIAYAIHRNKSIRCSAKLSSFVCGKFYLKPIDFN